mmetsp:Transcript_54708/g.150747  ORF Transcript_54708/g.150747 Transcript_54708/m.150747 type:complete len:413 (-) Transcript_54708:406-1644(-)
MPPMARYSSWREKQNAFIHACYVRHEHDECLRVIEEQLSECAFCEYPLYVKALILRQRGQIQESLTLFQSATCLNPNNTANLKQVGHSYYLLGKHKQAIQVYEEAQRIGEENVRKRNEVGRQARLSADDWEIWHNKGLCYIHMKQLGLAIESFQRANSIQRHDATYMQLGKVYQLQENFEEALKVYQDAIDFSPENPELLTTVGLVWLRLQENPKAFEQLGNSLTHDPRNAKTILAAGSIIQDNQEMDTALIKYRVAAVQTPNSAQLWNNIGMCFFGKGVRKVVTHVACVLAQPRESQEPTYFSYPPPTRLRVSFPHGGSLLFEARPLFGSFRVDHMLQPWASAPEHRPVCLGVPLFQRIDQPQIGLPCELHVPRHHPRSPEGLSELVHSIREGNFDGAGPHESPELCYHSL